MFAREKSAMNRKLAAKGLRSALVASYRHAYHQKRVEHNPVVIDHPQALVKVLYIQPPESVISTSWRMGVASLTSTASSWRECRVEHGMERP
jgi:hypothetical protein